MQIYVLNLCYLTHTVQAILSFMQYLNTFFIFFLIPTKNMHTFSETKHTNLSVLSPAIHLKVGNPWIGILVIQTLCFSHRRLHDYPLLIVLTCLINSTRPQVPLHFVTHYAWLGEQTSNAYSLHYMD